MLLLLVAALSASPAQAIDELVSRYAALQRFSGAVLVARDGKVVHARAYGPANYEHGVPNDVDTRFMLGSLAKQFTAAAILQKYRELYVRNGKLLDSIQNLGEDNFTGEDRYLGRAVAFRIDRFVIAFNGYKDRQKLIELAAATDARILASIRKQLVRADEEAYAAPAPVANGRQPWERQN